MKTACLVALLFVGAAMADQICLPFQFQWQSSSDFQPLANNRFGAFSISEEWYDYTNKNFRFRNKEWFNGVEYMSDVLLIGATQKMYVTNGTAGGGSINCTVQKSGFPRSWPCLYDNATIVGEYFVAGDVFTQVWSESQTTSSNITIYSELSLTAQDNIPVASRTFFTDEGVSVTLYYNFDINLDADAFDIPSICPQTVELEGVYPEAALRERFPMLRRQPPQE